jgi:hypothetical protein
MNYPSAWFCGASWSGRAIRFSTLRMVAQGWRSGGMS